ncbi:uncharacterized protein LOC128396185 [Panonychus citri]|uniref:uncharacterized protein LOC128396185 n=1 Tax=Panonychus citri TaxID=50023 RepID=UPI002307901C|nr:uncharacterized protein LOC128396185 [Panonychus citri]
MNILKCKLYQTSCSSSLLSSLFIHSPDPWGKLFLCNKKQFTSMLLFNSSSSSSLLSPTSSSSSSRAISQLTVSSIKSVIKTKPVTLFSVDQKCLPFKESLCCYQFYSSFGSDKHDSDSDSDDEKFNLSPDDGCEYPNFANQYRHKAETLKKDLSRITKVDKLFELIYNNIDYVGRINAGVFLSRLSHLIDPREKFHRKLTTNEIDFLTKLVVVNINVLTDANLLSLVSIILSQKLSDSDNLTITTLQEIRRRLNEIGIHHLIWIWKQSGFAIKSANQSREWTKLREEIINVVERRVDDFSYDFQNVTEISQLARILLSKSSSVPYLHRLIKNMTIFTESIDYGLAWALLIQLPSSIKKYQQIDSKDLIAIHDKCYKIIQQKLYETNFQMDNYVKDYFFQRIMESPNSVRLSFEPSFYKTLVKLVKTNQKQLGCKGLIKSLTFFGFNQYYPVELFNHLCNWIKDHPDEYLTDPDYRPTILMQLFGESRFFESRPKLWEQLSKILLDPMKISSLVQEEKFRLLSYLLIIGDYSHLNKFCPEFDDLCENMKLHRHILKAFHHIYAGLSISEVPIAIEGQLIKQSLEKYVRKFRRAFHFTDRHLLDNDFDEILTSTLGHRSNFTRKVWTKVNVVLDYVIAWDKQGKPYKFVSRGKHNISLIDDLIHDLENYHVTVLFPVDESHYCYDPPIMKGRFIFKLKLIKQLGFTPIIIDRRNWKDLTEEQKKSQINREIGNVKTLLSEDSTIKSSLN